MAKPGTGWAGAPSRSITLDPLKETRSPNQATEILPYPMATLAEQLTWA